MSNYYRSPKTTQERRRNGSRLDRFEESEYTYVRGKRKDLPTTYDDIQHGYQKSWKKLRKTQYRCGGRGKQHYFLLHNQFDYNLREWFTKYDIPYRITKVYQNHIGYYRKVNWVWTENAYKAWKLFPDGVMRHVWFNGWIEHGVTYTPYKYSSYRYSNVVYWTSKKLTLPTIEQLERYRWW